MNYLIKLADGSSLTKSAEDCNELERAIMDSVNLGIPFIALRSPYANTMYVNLNHVVYIACEDYDQNEEVTNAE